MPYKELSSLPQCWIIPQAVAHCGAGVWERGFSSLLERSSAATNESKDESWEWLLGVLQEQSQWYHPLPVTSNCAQVRVENTHWSNWSHLVKKMPHTHTSHWMNQITLEQIKKAGILSPKPLLVTYIFAQKASAPQIAPTSTSHPSYQHSHHTLSLP